MLKLSLNLLAIAVLFVCASKRAFAEYGYEYSRDYQLQPGQSFLQFMKSKEHFKETNSRIRNDQQNECTVKLNNLDEKFDSVNSILEILAEKIDQLDATLTTFANGANGGKKLLKGCAGALKNGPSNATYTVQLGGGGSKPYALVCMTDPHGGLPWTIIQRRVDNSTNFYRNWSEYRRGFGDLDKNFFIGLIKLHSLTYSPQEPQELWVQLTAPEGETRNAYYDRFAIGSVLTGHRLSELGEYTGDAGDSLAYHRGMRFTTYDQDNDLNDMTNCAKEHKGAWWYASCLNSNLNGEYGNDNFGQGVIWEGFRNGDVSLKYAHMAIRPASG